MAICGDGFTSGSRQASKEGPISEILHEVPSWEMVQGMEECTFQTAVEPASICS